MRCSPSAEAARYPSAPPRRSARALRALLLALFAWLLAAPAHAATFKVRDAHLQLVDGTYVLDANVDFDFSTESLKALRHGVPLTVIVDAEIVRQRTFLWDQTIAEHHARYRLQVHALSGRYLVKDLNSGRVRSFAQLDSALHALGTLTDLPMLKGTWLDPDQRYALWVRARLDVEALPSPLRPLAYLNSFWKFGSGWYEWPIKP